MNEKDAGIVSRLVAEQLAAAMPKGAPMNTSASAEAIVEAMKDYLRRNVGPLVARIEALEQSPMTFEGTFEQGRAYQRHAFVTHRGSLWHCNHATGTTPGGGGPEWTLAVKSGRDGRDAK